MKSNIKLFKLAAGITGKKEIIQLHDTYNSLKYSIVEGVYFEILGGDEVSDVYGCREGFAEYFNLHSNQIGFKKTDINIAKVRNFFYQIEKKLKLKEKLVFVPTNFTDTFVVRVPEFWRANHFRRQMFTLLLRCAACYFQDDLDAAFDAYYLSKAIKKTIHHFLNGNVHPKDKNCAYNGIVKKFEYVSETKLKEELYGGKIKKLTPCQLVLTHKLDI